MKKTKLLSSAALLIAALSISSCSKNKFHVKGEISDAKDSMLYFEDMTLNGPKAVDSVKLGKSGAFEFSAEATGSPQFYRLRIDQQIINIAADSTENIRIKASYPTMSGAYEVEGSTESSKIKALAQMQLQLQGKIDALANDPHLSVPQVEDSVASLLERYKDKVRTEYIYKEPMKTSSYFALFQTFNLGNLTALIFNPRASKEDVKTYAAVATSWDTYHPKSERGKNLHNIAIDGMKTIRILQNERAQQEIDANKVNTSGIIDIDLLDNKGNRRKLSDLKGKVVLLDFHLFASPDSPKRIMAMRDIYNKYHAQGLEIYQISYDPNEHFWKTQTAALPWVSVHDDNGEQSEYLVKYNIRNIPTFFLIDRNNMLQKRDAQISNLDKAIKDLL